MKAKILSQRIAGGKAS